MPQNIAPLYIKLNDYPNFLINLSLTHIAYFNSKIYPLKEQSHPLFIYSIEINLSQFNILNYWINTIIELNKIKQFILMYNY